MARPGTIAITDFDWYSYLSQQRSWDEVNFWKPTTTQPFRAPEFSPFFFKLKAPHRAIAGFGYFARYSELPEWLPRVQPSLEFRVAASEGDVGLPRYGSPVFVRPRLGQGAFRASVTEAYNRACAVTHEHCLPAVGAGHILPVGKEGPYGVTNG